MNAPFPSSQTAAVMSLDPLHAFLQNLSIEITAKQIEKLPLLRQRLVPGTKVFIALIDPADVAVQIEAARQLKAAGFQADPACSGPLRARRRRTSSRASRPWPAPA